MCAGGGEAFQGVARTCLGSTIDRQNEGEQRGKSGPGCSAASGGCNGGGRGEGAPASGAAAATLGDGGLAAGEPSPSVSRVDVYIVGP